MASSREIDLLAELRGGYRQVFATTFSIGPRFVDSYLTRRCEAFSEAVAVTMLVDASQYVSEYIESDYSSPSVNRDYFLHPVRVPGAFHPKLIFAVSEKEIVASIGSGNLSSAGLTSNVELADVWRVELKKATALPGVVSAAWEFLAEICRRQGCRLLEERLDDAKIGAPILAADTESRSHGSELALNSIGTPILLRVRDAIQDQIDSIEVLSPFLDGNSELLDEIFHTFPETTVNLYLQDGEVTASAKTIRDWKKTYGKRLGIHGIRLDENRRRYVHAKCVTLSSAARSWLLFGSANFTRAGLLSTYDDGNVEFCVLRRGKRAKTSPLRSLFKGKIAAYELEATQISTRTPTASAKQLSTPWTLSFVERDQDCVRLDAAGPDPTPTRVRLTRRESEKSQVVRVGADGHGRLVSGKVADADDFFSSPVLCALVDPNLRACSNTLFIEDSQERSGAASSHLRRVLNDAQKSAGGFAGSLRRLASSDDLGDLIDFFWFVRIPVLAVAPAHVVRIHRNQEQPPGFFERVGRGRTRNPRLDEAIARFWRLHTRRLRRHVVEGWRAGVPNFFQILSSLQSVLFFEQERVLFEVSGGGEISSDEWHRVRCDMDSICRKYFDVIEIVCDEYQPVLEKKYGEHGAIRALLVGREVLKDGFDALRKWHTDVEKARASVCVRIPHRGTVPARYFAGNTFDAWAEYSRKVNERVGTLLNDLASIAA